MLAIQAEEGEGLGHPSEPQPTPSTAQPTNEEPIPNVVSLSHQKTQTPRQALNKVTKLPQTSEPIPNILDEAVYEERDDRVERDTTTTTSLDAEHASGNITKTQFTAILNVPLPQALVQVVVPGAKKPWGVPLLKLGLRGLLEKVTSLEEDLKQTKLVYGKALTKLVKKVKSEDLSADDIEEDPSKQGKKIAEIDQDEGITLVQMNAETQGRFSNISTASVLVSTASAEVNTPSPTINTASLSAAETLMSLDEELAQKIHEEEVARLLAEFIDKRKKIQAQQRYEAIKNKPPTRAQRRKYMTTYLQNQANWKAHQFKGYSFKEIEDIFNKTYKKVQSFVPIESEATERTSELEAGGSQVEGGVGSYKRLAEEELQQESTKKHKTGEDELSKEDLQQMMMIVPVEVMNVETLQTKYPIINWEVYTNERSRKYWKIIRVGNHIEVYQYFVDMLKVIDRDDMVKLWSLVKERFSSAEPSEDMERSLCVELERLFKPDNDDTLWKLQRYMHDPLTWRLYDTCRVHHVSSVRGHDIYMLVEKDYPLSDAVLTLMLIAKLMVDEESEMANELLRKIFILANKPRR
ncbi:hypothetical protein Tco_1262558 [Tanacetum coccineum]